MSFKIYKNNQWVECAGQPSNYVPRVTTTTPSAELQDKIIMYQGDDSGIWKNGHIYQYKSTSYWKHTCTQTLITITSDFYTRTELSSTVPTLLYTDTECVTPSNFSATTTTLYESSGILEMGTVDSSTYVSGVYQWFDITDIPDLSNYVTTNTQQSVNNKKTFETSSQGQYTNEIDETGIDVSKYEMMGGSRAIIDQEAKYRYNSIYYTSGGLYSTLTFPVNKSGTFVLDTDLTSYYTKTQCDNLFPTKTETYTKTECNNKFDLKPTTAGTVNQIQANGGGSNAQILTKYYIDSTDYTNQSIAEVWNKCPGTDCTVILTHCEFQQSDDPKGTTGNKYEVEVHKTNTNYGYILAKNRTDFYKLNINNLDYDSWYVFETIKTGEKFKSFGWGSETETISANTSKRLCYATFQPGKWLITAHARTYPTGNDGFKAWWVTTNPNGSWYWEQISHTNRNQGDTQITMSGILTFTEDINVYLMFNGNVDCKVPISGIDAVKLK